jgi:1-deoxyxylulose-5-phosphate synthase
MNRRHFLRTTGAAALATFSGIDLARAAGAKRANDVVLLGPRKIRVSRLAMGTGTKSGSIQKALGVDGVADMLQFAYEHGVFYWETADAYQTHPHVAAGLKRVPREKVTIMTKTRARTADQMKADLDRFRKELGVDYIDIVLLHGNSSPTWADDRKGAADVLAEAREKKIARACGGSFHNLEALRAAAKTPWLDVALARINPAGVMMDSEPPKVVAALRELKAAGKGVIGMKILGEGQLTRRLDEALRYALSLDCLDCFTIGAGNRGEVTDLVKRIAAA